MCHQKEESERWEKESKVENNKCIEIPDSLVALKKCYILFKHMQFKTAFLLLWDSIRIHCIDEIGWFIGSEMLDEHQAS